MKKVERFFCYCAGVSPSLLKRCPTENSKFVGIGAAIFFTGLLACISSAYALYFVFDQVFLSVSFGIVWGLMIFNLDRVIVQSMRKREKNKHEMIQALPRIAMAILIAVVISKPLELKIFEKEINSELLLIQQELLLDGEKAIAQRFVNSSDSLNKEKKSILASIAQKQTKRDELLELARQEADGTGGSGKVNPGPIYHIKKENADRAQQELEELINTSELSLTKIDQELSILSTAESVAKQKLEISDVNGISFQLTALDRLGKKYAVVYYSNLFIILLFIVLEILPILAKILAPRGPYDDLLEVHEKYFESYRKEKVYKEEKKLEQLIVAPN